MSTYTSSLGLELITPGSQAGLWGNTTNNTFTLIDQAVTGVTPVSFASASGSTYTLTDFNGAADEARSAVLNITGSAIGANTVVIPNKQKTYLVRNNTGQDVTFQTAVPTATYTVGAGYSILVFCDGNNNVFTGIASPSVGTLSVAGGGTGTTTFLSGGFIKSAGSTSALTASQYVALGSEVSGTLPVSNGGTGVASITANNLVVGAGTSAVTFIAPGTAGQVLTSNGTVWQAATPSAGVTSVSASLPLSSSGGTTPNISITGQVGVANGGTGVATFASGFVKSPGLTSNLTTVTSIDLSTSDVSGTLTVGRGGTGAASLTSSALLVGNGTGSITSISPGSNGTVLTSNGSAWAAASLPTSVTSISSGAGISVTGTTTPTIANTGVIGITAGTNVTITPTGSGTYSISATAGGTGTVTSVAASGGTTGMSFTGTPITTSGTLTLGGTLAVASGGTNKTTWVNGAVSVSGNVFSSGTLDITLGGTGATSASGAATSLGFVPKTGGAFTGNVTNSGYFLGSYVYAGTSTTASVIIGAAGIGSSVNFYAPSTGNGYNSIYYSASGTSTSSQLFAMAFNNGTGSLYAPFQFNGIGNASAVFGSWIDGSDRRIKENITPLSSGVDIIGALNPVKYSFIADKLQEPNRYGLIAQEVEQVIPEVVFTSPDESLGIEDFKAVAYTNLIPVLIKAIQELKAEVDALKAAK